MKKLGFLLAAMFLLCASQVSAQVYYSRSTAQLALDGKTEVYNYKSEAITFYLNMNSRTLNFYCKPYTFVNNEPASEAKTLLIDALAMNSDNAGVMEFKASLPATFKMPTAGKSVKATVTGDMIVAGVKKTFALPLVVQADANGKNFSYSLNATFDLNNLGIELSKEVKEKTKGLIHLSFTDVALKQKNRSQK